MARGKLNTLFRRSRYLCCAMLALLGTSIFCYCLWSSAKNVHLENEGLSIGEEYLQLGQVWETDSYSWAVLVQNHSAKRIDVLDVASSCVCTAIIPRSFSLESGETKTVTLTVDFTKTDEPNFRVKIIPQIKDSDIEQAGWKISAVVRKAVVADPKVVSFVEPLCRGFPYASRTVTMKTNIAVRRLAATYPQDRLRVRICGTGANYQIEVTPLDILPLGPFEYAVNLHAETETGELIALPKLPVTGWVTEPIFVSPERVLFGSRNINDAGVDTVRLGSRTDGAFSVIGVDIDTPDIQVSPGRGKSEFRIASRFSKTGSVSNTVFFRVIPEGKVEVVRLPLQVDYYGIATEKARN
jgi:hypothetical protein